MSEKDKQSVSPIAIEEWKLTSSVIARLEGVEHQMRGWLFALITGLTVALFSENIQLPSIAYLIIGNLLVIMFVWMDLNHRMPKRHAIQLSKEIEKCIREKCEYLGPTLTERLAGPRINRIAELRRMVRNTPYMQILGVVNILGITYYYFHQITP